MWKKVFKSKIDFGYCCEINLSEEIRLETTESSPEPKLNFGIVQLDQRPSSFSLPIEHVERLRDALNLYLDIRKLL